jgi:deoxyribodipyrimidine photo-lyase
MQPSQAQAPTIVWFRRDLRLHDNPALDAAVQHGGPIIPVFIWAPEEEEQWAPGGASRWWLHQSLASLAAALHERGSRLILRRGSSLRTLQDVVRTTGARAVLWNRRYEPSVRQRDATITATLRAQSLTVESWNAGLLYEPWEVATKAGKPFKVFTPFWKACLARSQPAEPLSPPTRLPAPAEWPATLQLAQFELEPTIDWAAGMRATWRPGCHHAIAQLDRFVEQAMHGYAQDRDRPDLLGTSRLSPYLHFGEISPRQVWHRVQDAVRVLGRTGKALGAEAYLRELGWREFAHHVLYHFPHTTTQPLRPDFAAFPWRDERQSLRAWQRGRTGYPLVDAGMRELWTTGWMHNRVRMVVASFLVKHLLLPWQAGTAWFWDTLVDADLANNTLGWQWAAGCGADAAPYFRIFNPMTQGQKFDPQGVYVRRWIPELTNIPTRWIQQPWEAPQTVLSEAGVTLGRTYPLPIVDHRMARERALAAFAAFRDRR